MLKDRRWGPEKCSLGHFPFVVPSGTLNLVKFPVLYPLFCMVLLLLQIVGTD